MTDTQTEQKENEYFIGPIEVESSGDIGSIGHNLILFTRKTERKNRYGYEEAHLAKFWNGKGFGPEINLPTEGRRSRSFKVIGNTIFTNRGYYDHNEDQMQRAWTLENGKFVEIPCPEDLPTRSSIYKYDKTFYERDPICPLRSHPHQQLFARVLSEHGFGPETRIPLVENSSCSIGPSFISYSVSKKDKYDLVARVVDGKVLGKEQVLIEGANSKLDVSVGSNFLANYSDDTKDLTAWVLREGVFTPQQRLTTYNSQSGIGFASGGNILVYFPGYNLPGPIYAYILKE